MGVIYKFKPEVVGFVIQKKKENFSLSCRKLAELIFGQFHIKVSKSAVNNILSQSSLNSPPKRPVDSYGTSKKFQIPENKKRQLFNIVKKSLEESMGASVILKESQMHTIKKVMVTKGHVDDERLHKNNRRIVNKEQHQSNSLKCSGSLSENPKRSVFFRVAALEVCMGKYIRALESTETSEWEKNDEKYRSLVEEYDNKKNQAFLEVSSIVVALEGGREFVFDPRFSTIWGDSGVPVFLSCPSCKAMEWLSSRLISNNQPVLLNSLQEECLFEMITFFEGVGVGAEKVLVFSGESILAEFSAIPVKKRNFAVGVWNSQDGFSEWIKNVQSKEAKAFYHEGLKKSFYFCDGVDRIGGGGGFDLRVLVLWEQGSPEPFLVILTNQINKSGENVIFDYLLRWPKYFPETSKFFPLKKRVGEIFREQIFQDWDEIDKVLENFEKSLREYCCQHFFSNKARDLSEDEINYILFGIPSKGSKEGKVFYSTLFPPKGYPHSAILQSVVDRVNGNFIQSEGGHKYHFFIA